MMKTKQKKINVRLDKFVSLLVQFDMYNREDTMFFHIADRQYGLEWSPTKKAIAKLIVTLQKVEGMMTDKTNKF
jgi:hypothetical protein